MRQNQVGQCGEDVLIKSLEIRRCGALIISGNSRAVCLRAVSSECSELCKAVPIIVWEARGLLTLIRNGYCSVPGWTRLEEADSLDPKLQEDIGSISTIDSPPLAPNSVSRRTWLLAKF